LSLHSFQALCNIDYYPISAKLQFVLRQETNKRLIQACYMKLYLRYRFNVDECVVRSPVIAFHAQDDRDCLIQNFWFWQSPVITHDHGASPPSSLPSLPVRMLYVGMSMTKWALKLHDFEIIVSYVYFLQQRRQSHGVFDNLPSQAKGWNPTCIQQTKPKTQREDTCNPNEQTFKSRSKAPYIRNNHSKQGNRPHSCPDQEQWHLHFHLSPIPFQTTRKRVQSHTSRQMQRCQRCSCQLSSAPLRPRLQYHPIRSIQ